MIFFIKNFYNTIYNNYTFIYVLYFLCYNDLNKLSNEKLIEFKKYIIKSGPICIKFIQWYLSNNLINQNINDIFCDLFNKCPEHSINITESIFKKDFNENLNSILNINNLEIIGSGSIGQVYKGELLNGDKIALKVKHPNSDSILKSQKISINIILFFQKIHYFRKIFNLHFNLKDFIHDLYLQINFKNEVYNCLKLKKNFKDNPLVIIPKIHFYSENVIIYSYEDGEDINTLSEYKQRKLGLSFYTMLYKMVTNDNFIHGDLHKENWKVRRDSNKLKIVLYDFGLCHYLISTKVNKNIWISFEENKFEELFDNIEHLVNKEHYECLNETDIKELKSMIYKTSLKSFSLLNILNNIKYFFKKKNLFLNKNLFNILITMILLQNLFIKTRLVNSFECNFKEKKISVLDRISDLGAFTKKYDFYNNIYNCFETRRINLIEDIKKLD